MSPFAQSDQTFMNLLHSAHPDSHHGDDSIRLKLTLVEIERQVDIDDHILIAVETELDVAVLSFL